MQKVLKNSQNNTKANNKFSKVVRYKIHTQKVILYTRNRQPKNGSKKTISFTRASKIKYLVINVTKDIQDLYTENDKILLKEIKEDINKWKDIPCS